MKTHSLSASLLALATALTLSACTTEEQPTAPGAAPGGAETPAASGAPAPEAAAPLVTVEDPAAVLEVEDQTSEGPTVRVKLAAVSKGGHVVVSSGGGSNILGSTDVPAGTTAATLQVSLAEDVNTKTELTAQLFNDEDGNGVFSAPDRPVTNGKDDEDDDAERFAGELEVFSFTGKSVVNG